MQVESNATPLLTFDEEEKGQRQRIASFIGHVFQMTKREFILSWTDLCGKKSWNADTQCSKRGVTKTKTLEN